MPQRAVLVATVGFRDKAYVARWQVGCVLYTVNREFFRTVESGISSVFVGEKPALRENGCAICCPEHQTCASARRCVRHCWQRTSDNALAKPRGEQGCSQPSIAAGRFLKRDRLAFDHFGSVRLSLECRRCSSFARPSVPSYASRSL